MYEHSSITHLLLGNGLSSSRFQIQNNGFRNAPRAKHDLELTTDNKTYTSTKRASTFRLYNTVPKMAWVNIFFEYVCPSLGCVMSAAMYAGKADVTFPCRKFFRLSDSFD